MVLRLGVGLLALVLVAGLPAHAQTVNQTNAQREAKGTGVPLPVIDSTDIPTIGDNGAAALPSRQRPTTTVQLNDSALDNVQFFPNALPQPQRPYELSTQSETSAAAFGNDVVVGFNNSADQP